MKFSRFSLPARIGSYSWLTVLALILIAPILWLTLSVFKPSVDIIGKPFSLPTTFSWQNVIDAWNAGQFNVLFVNSLEITVISVFGILVIEGLASYAFSRLGFAGKAILFVLFMAGQFVPPQVIILPSFLEMSALGLSDTKVSLIFQYLSWAPVAILFLSASMSAIPRELEEAAMIDGANRITILWRIILPMSKSAFATVGTIYTLWIYNDFLFPLIYIKSAANATVPLGLAQFQGLFTTYWGYLIGAIFISIWPPLIIYGIFSRQIQSRFAEGALKG